MSDASGKDDQNTAQQQRFLELFHIAAKFDCLYLLDFHCMNEFNHDSVTALTDDERHHLTVMAEKEIFEHALQAGYRPAPAFGGDGHNDYLC